jgi:hypothetical protein
MTPQEIIDQAKIEMNRPPVDDLFDPGSDDALYLVALTRVRDRARQKIAQHGPWVLLEESTAITPEDATGETYDLGDDWFAGLEVWTPPGVDNGRRIYPGFPGMAAERFWIQGQILHLTIPKVFSPGLYLRWIPATPPAVTLGGETSLPLFMDWYLLYEMCALMASRPGSGLDAVQFRGQARDEWYGKPDDPSDVGILGQLKKQMANMGEAHLPSGSYWWRGLPTFTG